MTTFLEACTGLGVGIPVIRCLNAEANYVMGYLLLSMLFAILYFNLDFEPVKDRLAAVLLAVCVASILFSLVGLVHPQAFSYSFILAIGAGAALMMRR
jgi:hypothetical protein